ncbi:glucosamine-6-phosphate deaminase [Glaciibacter superstes]|uniref:glucosamine-6-phosphate deaminase n=1 Tax=Glaciibacter superstes TaxID=501023 RepID=UPI0003B7845E|nr:glucosamine-6-phosphate deaminase [Glaciibacter superstes]
MSQPSNTFIAGNLAVEVYDSEQAMGRAAAQRAAAVITDAITARGEARVVVATGNSQFEFVNALQDQPIDWGRVTVFHMDEYVGMDGDHSASFVRWIRERVEVPFHPARVEYIHGNAPDPEAECARYEVALREAPLDLVCMGIGENGHIAFNEPFEANVNDDRFIRIIELNDVSRRQQVGEGHFPSVADVPAQAMSLTVPALLSARVVQVCAPESRKAEAVAKTMSEPISNAVPSTYLRNCPHATLFLDPSSAGQIATPAGN